MCAFKLRGEHWETIVNFMESNKDIATGRCLGLNGKEEYKRKWSELSSKLNALGLGLRSVVKWQKTWTDMKCNLKKKAAAVKASQNGTGGGPPADIKLTEIESRVLAIIGKTAWEGSGVKERGVPLPSQVQQDVSQEFLSLSDDKENEPVIVRKRPAVLTPSTSTAEDDQLLSNDHDYLFHSTPRPKKKKLNKEDEIKNMYSETLKCMRDIHRTLERGLQEINVTLANGFLSLCDALTKRNS